MQKKHLVTQGGAALGSEFIPPSKASETEMNVSIKLAITGVPLFYVH